MPKRHIVKNKKSGAPKKEVEMKKRRRFIKRLVRNVRTNLDLDLETTAKVLSSIKIKHFPTNEKLSTREKMKIMTKSTNAFIRSAKEHPSGFQTYVAKLV